MDFMKSPLFAKAVKMAAGVAALKFLDPAVSAFARNVPIYNTLINAAAPILIVARARGAHRQDPRRAQRAAAAAACPGARPAQSRLISPFPAAGEGAGRRRLSDTASQPRCC